MSQTRNVLYLALQKLAKVSPSMNLHLSLFPRNFEVTFTFRKANVSICSSFFVVNIPVICPISAFSTVCFVEDLKLMRQMVMFWEAPQFKDLILSSNQDDCDLYPSYFTISNPC